jgi:hypothetical protein
MAAAVYNQPLHPFDILDMITGKAMAMQCICLAYVSGHLEEGLAQEFDAYVATAAPELAKWPTPVGGFFNALSQSPNPAEAFALYMTRYTINAGSALRWANGIKYLSILGDGIGPAWAERDLLTEQLDRYAALASGVATPETPFEVEARLMMFASYPFVSLRETVAGQRVTSLGEAGNTISEAISALASLALTDLDKANQIATEVIDHVRHGLGKDDLLP